LAAWKGKAPHSPSTHSVQVEQTFGAACARQCGAPACTQLNLWVVIPAALNRSAAVSGPQPLPAPARVRQPCARGLVGVLAYERLSMSLPQKCLTCYDGVTKIALGIKSQAEWQSETTAALVLLQVLSVSPNAVCRRSAEPCCAQVRLAHRVAELENLPYGLSAKAPVLKVSAGYRS